MTSIHARPGKAASHRTVLVRLDGTGAAMDAFARKFRRLPAAARKALTYDQRKAIVRREELARRASSGSTSPTRTAPGGRPAARMPTAG